MVANRSTFAALAVVLAGIRPAAAQSLTPPIIDMHLHAHSLSAYGGGVAVCTNEHDMTFPGVDPTKPITFDLVVKCASPMRPPASDEAVMRDSLAMLRRYNIRAVTSGSLELVSAWRAAAPDRIIPAQTFSDTKARTPEEFRRLHAEGRLAVLSEIGAQYRGLSLADESYDPFFALAESLDVPVGVHLGEGPPAAVYVGEAGYRARLTSPLQLEEVLLRHPRLRIWVMHYASPLVDEMIALLYSHPQVYVDIAQNNWGFPRAHFYGQLKRLMDAGFGERVMWGSDQMIWPETIRVAVETIESAPFLTARQKRDIFYNNAARFLRLDEQEIARDHARR